MGQREMSATALLRYLTRLSTDGFAQIIAQQFNRVDHDPSNYVTGRIIPWSQQYLPYRNQFLSHTVADRESLNRFRTAVSLPSGYGYALDERCIEYPWVLANMDNTTGILLDAGSTFNYPFVLNCPALSEAKIHILTLAPESNCYWQRGVGYLYQDLRDIPIRDDYYDSIISISTLEHVGMDNSTATRDIRHREASHRDFVLAIKELRRVLRPGGEILFTVPFGRYADQGFQQQFDSELLAQLIDAFGATSDCVKSFYRYTSQGWNIATEGGCGDAEYVTWIANAWTTRQWPEPIPVEPDHAAAARAVACVKLIKP
jgi:SAM-dependent methyltransferase